ncbi:septation protein SepH [Bifidobacterium gallicum]|uniref:DNA binding protein n=2 Tax=Bifidobacterium gallicum TaxID=78342 RepID=D1NRW5_9BIFI|nr:septation protein SepH [Bifidobacterium gallicum]EFA23417.1 hypothetical protein BIFGAL_02516 [Bifidobacterium gallicum DSM 20093 = LMG 11596]KFI57286.1 DNA binding protein [Bifidobacterium gallicum DSM 20093 = LMG 11596]
MVAGIPKARFDHVTDDGDLAFSMGTQTFLVDVNEELDRAIMSAKQIKSDHIGEQHVEHKRTIPISQIQQLIRAGLDPHTVAERYDLDETLVRRFSGSVESEKNYAIKQFLNVAAPKEAKVHTISELIDRTLAALRVNRSDVHWSATRRAIEPWHITASFTTAEGRRIHAQWSWSTHDNAIGCLNSAARTLLGEQSTPAPSQSDDDDLTLQEAVSSSPLPGDSARSARIELAVSSAQQAAQPKHAAPAPQADDRPSSLAPAAANVQTADTDDTVVEVDAMAQGAEVSANDKVITAEVAEVHAHVAGSGHDAGKQQSSSNTTTRQNAQTVGFVRAMMGAASVPPADPALNQPAPAQPAPAPANETGSLPVAPTATPTVTPESAGAPPTDDRERTTRHGGRKQMPSWDEILFGKGE